MKKYKTGIYVGKFYPFQEGHLQTLEKIANLCEKVFVVFYNDKKTENDLKKELNYSIEERLEDTKLVLKNKNVEVIIFTPPAKLVFPKDYLEIKNKLFKQLKVDYIDLQIFGEDEEEKYKNYIYAKDYITGPNIYENGVAIHAKLIRSEYDKYKYLLNPIIRKRLDNKLKKQKYICIVGKSGSGKSSIAKYIENNLDKCISIDIDKIAHESHLDEDTKNKIINLVSEDILDEDNNIDRKKLGKIVFNNLKIKDKVYNITWEYIDSYIQKIVKKKYKYIILDWYNINTKIYWNIATLKILTDRDYESRKKDVMIRDNITSEYFDLREKNSNNYNNLVYDYKVNFEDIDKLKTIIDILKQ